MTVNKLAATVKLTGKIHCLTGLHIGGTEGAYEIGGTDKAVVKNPYTELPYIPGSSLKGKMRSLMEWAEGKVALDGNPYNGENDPDNIISPLFGTSADVKKAVFGPGRLVVRDAFPDEKTKEEMEKLRKKQGVLGVELKTEVRINRITSKTDGALRKIERVPAGSKFDFEILLFLYDFVYESKENTATKNDLEKAEKYINAIFDVLELLEHSALGGSGSRGSGQVEFLLGDCFINPINVSEKTNSKEKVVVKGNSRTLSQCKTELAASLKTGLAQLK